MKKTVSGIVLMLLLTSVISSVLIIQPVKAEPGTIYIRADGSVDPPTASISSVDNITYTFTGNIYDEVVIEKGNLIIDGNDFKSTSNFKDDQIELTIFSGEIAGGNLSKGNDMLDAKWFTIGEIARLPLRGSWVKHFI